MMQGDHLHQKTYLHICVNISLRNLWSQPFYYILMRFSFNNQEITYRSTCRDIFACPVQYCLFCTDLVHTAFQLHLD